MTGIGVILGTAAYMSPEQAKGREADRRSDIWAFGAVFYEMLTGRRAFDGEDMAEVLGAVVRLEPNWEALPADVPLPVRTLLQGCLVKDRGRRVADISTALFVLDKAANLAGPAATVAAAPLPLPPLWRRVITPVAAALLAATVAGTGVWFTTRAGTPVAARLSRWQITPSGDAALTIRDSERHLAITPDGSHLIYVGNRGTELFVRALDALEPVSVFTRFPIAPFVSPDSQWIGFSDEGMLKKVPVNGGPPVPITKMDASTSRGASWGRNDTIIFATTNGATGLQQVATGGGPTTVLTRPDVAQGEGDHVWPEWLPGEEAVLFTITAATGNHEAAQVAVLDLKTRSRKVLLRGGSHAHYLPSGHLVYATAGTLRAVPFDLARLETRGPPVAAVRDVLTTAGGDLDAVVAADGTLAYVPGGVATGEARTLVWVDRQGRETPIPLPPRNYSQPRLSPDGKRIAVFTVDQDLDLWLSDIDRPTLTRLTSGAGVDFSPVWTRDGRALIFSSQRASAGNIFRQPANGSGAVERLSESPLLQNPTAITPDGRSLIFTEIAEATRDDVMQMALDGSRAVTPVLRTSFAERNGIVSPDGRWLAYEANDSGPFEIFVRPYPDVNSGLAKVSVAGGVRPLWAPSGRELFFVSPSGAVMRVGVLPGPSWAATAPALLVKDGYYTSPGNPGRTYDISPDGQRLLLIKGPGAGGTAAPASLVVVQHWLEELKRLVATK